MNNQSILLQSKKFISFGVVGLIIGVLLTGLVMANRSTLNPSQPTTMTHEDQQNKPSMNMSMQDMMDSLKGMTGDDFDKAFISGMIEHHQGAINMAEAAKVNAKHEEIKAMADDIISAQTREIEQMRQWQKDWGYAK